MSIKSPNIITDPKQPFLNCRLGREKYGKILTNIVTTYADGFVLAIDGKWGSGKTTFVNMWNQQLRNEGFKTICFNAWENDFDDKPLPAILAELKTLIGKGKSISGFKKVVSKVAIFGDKALPIIAKAVAKQLNADELLQALIEASTKGATAVLQGEIDEYAKKKTGLIEFRTELAKYIESVHGDKPVVFIIDELDRCRPDYAVQVLEQIKHFFSVPGIVFVLSTDLVQLGHAVRGVYGSEKIDAEEYLRRFIDLQYSLPEADVREFCYFLTEHFQWKNYFQSNVRLSQKGDDKDTRKFNNMAAALSTESQLTLRQIEKLYAYTSVVIKSFDASDEIFPDVIYFLLYCKHYQQEFYEIFKNQKVQVSEFCIEFAKIIPHKMNLLTKRDFLNLEAELIFMYGSMLSNDPLKQIVRTQNDDTMIALFDSEIGFTVDEFGKAIKHFYYDGGVNGRNAINNWIKKIDLVENFK